MEELWFLTLTTLLRQTALSQSGFQTHSISFSPGLCRLGKKTQRCTCQWWVSMVPCTRWWWRNLTTPESGEWQPVGESLCTQQQAPKVSLKHFLWRDRGCQRCDAFSPFVFPGGNIISPWWNGPPTPNWLSTGWTEHRITPSWRCAKPPPESALRWHEVFNFLPPSMSVVMFNVFPVKTAKWTVYFEVNPHTEFCCGSKSAAVWK